MKNLLFCLLILSLVSVTAQSFGQTSFITNKAGEKMASIEVYDKTKTISTLNGAEIAYVIEISDQKSIYFHQGKLLFYIDESYGFNGIINEDHKLIGQMYMYTKHETITFHLSLKNTNIFFMYFLEFDKMDVVISDKELNVLSQEHVIKE